MPPRALTILTLMGVILTGCELDGWLRFGAADDARLTLGITDAPADRVAEVRITFTGVALLDEDGRWTRLLLDRPRSMDLMKLQGERRKLLLDAVSVEPRRYRFVQLLVDTSDSHVALPGGGQHSLLLDERNNELFGTDADFTVADDGTLDLTIDIDLRRGLDGPTADNAFLLRPSMRLVRTERSGTISGEVSNSMRDSGRDCANERDGDSVYVFKGRHTKLEDMHGAAGGPLTSVRLDADNSYTAAYLPAGDYTLAFTCQGADDRPWAEDDIKFSTPINAEVTAGDTTTIDFTKW